MDEFFRNLFAYDAWANRRALESLQAMEDLEDKPLKLLSHIIASQHNWHCRLTGRTQEMMEFYPTFGLEEIAGKIKELSAIWPKFIEENKGDLGRRVKYRSSEGQEFESALQDILMQLIGHANYHRAQLASAIKAEGGKPAVTDYIVFTRTKA